VVLYKLAITVTTSLHYSRMGVVLIALRRGFIPTSNIFPCVIFLCCSFLILLMRSDFFLWDVERWAFVCLGFLWCHRLICVDAVGGKLIKHRGAGHVF